MIRYVHWTSCVCLRLEISSEDIIFLNLHRLTIQPSHQSSRALPAAHTCFSILDLPISYTSPAIMKERLLTALAHSQGFGLA
jgi:hypothetical protein